VSIDTAGVEGFLDDLLNDIDSAVRPAAQAGAQVIYDEAKRAVPVSQHAHWFYGTHDRYLFKAGTLRDSIYQAFSADHSGVDRATYHISWNYRKCPYGFMVEFGTISAPARPFIRRAAEKGEQAMDAAEKKLMELIHGPNA
jgi:HK97 gp10 family phage protein